jgi:hypothetical protein
LTFNLLTQKSPSWLRSRKAVKVMGKLSFLLKFFIIYCDHLTQMSPHLWRTALWVSMQCLIGIYEGWEKLIIDNFHICIEVFFSKFTVILPSDYSPKSYIPYEGTPWESVGIGGVSWATGSIEPPHLYFVLLNKVSPGWHQLVNFWSAIDPEKLEHTKNYTEVLSTFFVFLPLKSKKNQSGYYYSFVSCV